MGAGKHVAPSAGGTGQAYDAEGKARMGALAEAIQEGGARRLGV